MGHLLRYMLERFCHSDVNTSVLVGQVQEKNPRIRFDLEPFLNHARMVSVAKQLIKIDTKKGKLWNFLPVNGSEESKLGFEKKREMSVMNFSWRLMTRSEGLGKSDIRVRAADTHSSRFQFRTNSLVFNFEIGCTVTHNSTVTWPNGA